MATMMIKPLHYCTERRYMFSSYNLHLYNTTLLTLYRTLSSRLLKIALPNWIYLKFMIRTLKQYIGTLISKRWAMSSYLVII